MNQRVGKVADRIHQIIARRLDKGLRDPRLGFVTITEVRLTGDLQQASVFYTVYGSDSEREGTAHALRAATGLLRSEVAKNLGTRLTPTIEFIPDQLPESAAHLTDLLEQARARDAETAALAANAEYAGDPDPYSKPAAAETEEFDEEDEFAHEDDWDDAEEGGLNSAGDADTDVEGEVPGIAGEADTEDEKADGFDQNSKTS
ncbi:MAG: 30S ribosome-binding factor RbfA [Microbacteriaceae bacterium]|nr:30S ribosome-binding factor RbfA [Microbacteriaceae bacterium]